MRVDTLIKLINSFIILFVIYISIVGFKALDKSNDKYSTRNDYTVVDKYLMRINNIEMPLNNYGVLADVSIPIGDPYPFSKIILFRWLSNVRLY